MGSSPINDDSLDNIIFDPPFLTYIRDGRKHGSIMGERFGGYWNYRELETHYRRTLMEIRRVLSINSILIMKCQDIIHNHKMHCTHHNVINWAEQLNFELIDLFILVAKNRIINKTFKGTTRIQKHSRIFHSYFLVFKKKQ